MSPNGGDLAGRDPQWDLPQHQRRDEFTGDRRPGQLDLMDVDFHPTDNAQARRRRARDGKAFFSTDGGTDLDRGDRHSPRAAAGSR